MMQNFNSERIMLAQAVYFSRLCWTRPSIGPETAKLLVGGSWSIKLFVTSL